MIHNIDKIDPDDIANINDIPLLQSLKCSIDLIIPTHPIICSQCENVFCQDCLKEWKKKSKNCPLCKSIFIESKRKNTILTQQLHSIRLYCKYAQNGCTFHPLTSEKASHEQSCPYQWKTCSKCNNLYIQKKYSHHIIYNCTSYFVPCLYCNTNISIISLNEHLHSQCNALRKIHFDVGVYKCKECGLYELHRSNGHKCPFKERKSGEEYLGMLVERYKGECERIFNEKKGIVEKGKGIIKEMKGKMERVLNLEMDVLDGEIEKRYKNLEKKRNAICEKLRKEIRMEIKENKKWIEKVKERERELEEIGGMVKKEEMWVERIWKEELKCLEKEMNIRKCIIRKIMNKEFENEDKEEKRNEDEYNLLIETNNKIYENEMKGICMDCKELTSNINKCEICLKSICANCNIKCSCKMHTFISNNNSTICKECIFKCNRCYNKTCKNCYKPCYNPKCLNKFCKHCYQNNSHHIKHPSESCNIFTCTICNNTNICIISTIFTKDHRECSKCFHSKQPSPTDYLFI